LQRCWRKLMATLAVPLPHGASTRLWGPLSLWGAHSAPLYYSRCEQPDVGWHGVLEPRVGRLGPYTVAGGPRWV